MMTTLSAPVGASLLSRVIAPEQSMLSPAAAEEVLRWGFSPQDHATMADLAKKARAGTLTDEERALSDGYVLIDSFLSIIKSKARRTLKTLAVH